MENAREASVRLAESGNIYYNIEINEFIIPDLQWGNRFFQNDETGLPLSKLMPTLWNADFHNALILGDGGMGKSTMMYHESRRLLESGRLAVYISLQAREGSGNESLIEYILRSLFRAMDNQARSRLVSLAGVRHEKPDLILFIDGFNELSGSAAQRYVAEIKTLAQYAGIQIIVSSRLDFLRDYGLSYFGMIYTCDLREKQISGLFTEVEWRNILEHRELRILLKNPMMATLYARTCPIVDRHKDKAYLDWKLPITNSTELLHDYYLAQVANLLDRIEVNGKSIFDCLFVIERVMTKLGYITERRNTTAWDENTFEQELKAAVDEANTNGDDISDNLRRIKRTFRVHNTTLSEDRCFELIVSELCLLRYGNGTVSFRHQIFRDYLAAVYLDRSLFEERSVKQLWHDEVIHKGVVQYLRYMQSWDTVNHYLAPYRGQHVSADDMFVINIVNCWLGEGNEERDLSGLDLRNVSLSDQLKTKFTGTINIDRALVSKATFVNVKHHNQIIDICFSHDHKTMAAISQNGIVSVTNISTQSQMIVGELEHSEDAVIGFDSNDYLLVNNNYHTFKWPTISYDRIEDGDFSEIITTDSLDKETKDRINTLLNRIKASRMYGCKDKASEDGRYLAIGFESGFIQVWDVSSMECIENLSLSESQIATVSFTSDGSLAALGSGSNLVQLWNIKNRQFIRSLYFENRISQVRFPARGNYLECRFSDGKYHKVDLTDGTIGEELKTDGIPLISKKLLKRVNLNRYKEIESGPHGNAILLDENGKAYTWDEGKGALSECTGHKKKVMAIALCRADERFAATYSSENYISDRSDGYRRIGLHGQKLVRVRIVSIGQCQWRLPTKGRDIRKLQFFTTNRIILAGLATNGDILLWELVNKIVHGREQGRWDVVEIVHNNQAEPIECAVPLNKEYFISAYSDGSILLRPFTSNDGEVIHTLPGIDAGVLRWNDIECDEDLKETLRRYCS